jgi:hypothetical protein
VVLDFMPYQEQVKKRKDMKEGSDRSSLIKDLFCVLK